MNTHANHDVLKNEFDSLFNPRSEKVEERHDALMLMAAFLSEIEAIQNKKNISRKELAKKIHTSGSYLTQVFRSKKPLNFVTLAKIKRALDIRFEIRAFPKEMTNSLEINPHEYNQLSLTKFAQEYLLNTSDTIPAEGSTFNILPSTITISSISKDISDKEGSHQLSVNTLV